MVHLDEGTLAAVAQHGDGDSIPPAAARHLASCDVCSAAVGEYRALHALTSIDAVDTPEQRAELAAPSPARRTGARPLARPALVVLLTAVGATLLLARCAVASAAAAWALR